MPDFKFTIDVTVIELEDGRFGAKATGHSGDEKIQWGDIAPTRLEAAARAVEVLMQHGIPKLIGMETQVVRG